MLHHLFIVVCATATIIAFWALGSALILIHELGHAWALLRVGIIPREIVVGVGPVLLEYRGLRTFFTLRLIPFSGVTRLPPCLPIHRLPAMSRTTVAIAGPMASMAAGFIADLVFIFAIGPGQAYQMTTTNLAIFSLTKAVAHQISGLAFPWIYLWKMVAGQHPLGIAALPVTKIISTAEPLIASIGIFAMLSLLTASFNLLPIPTLDGWEIIDGIRERISGRRLSDRMRLSAKATGKIVVGLVCLLVFLHS